MILILYLLIAVIGYFIGTALAKRNIALKGMSVIQTVAVTALVFFMGSRIGADESIVKSLDSIGLTAFIMTLFILAGSVLAVFLTRKLLGFDKEGNLVRFVDPTNSAKHTESIQKPPLAPSAVMSPEGPDDFMLPEEAVETASVSSVDSIGTTDSEDAGADHTMTICITVSVIAGILAGYFILPSGFVEISGNLIVAGLSLLLLFVGMDIGVEGTLVANFKRAGWRVIVFPFAIIIGTFAGAIIASLVLPITAKDALCVGSGIGWYTLAPAMLAEYSMKISAMSFMHNVMRELIGILVMPIVAEKLGYIETISLPGSSSMDVCLPIVERITKSEIAVYSFISGAVLSAAVPILVSFLMGL